MINSVLSDNAARAYIFGRKNYLILGDRPVAAKTGTTNDYHDAWTIGYTPSLVTGVWVGNSNNKEMKGKADGSVLAAPIWHDFMAKILGDTPAENFKAPDDYKAGKPILDGQIPSQLVKVDKSSGLLATDATPPELIEERNAAIPHSILFYVDKTDPRGATPTNPASDPQFNLWETAIQKWAEQNASSSGVILPTNYDNLHKTENKPIIKILAPLKNQTITSPSLEVQIEASAIRGISRVEYYINNNLWQTRWGSPVMFTSTIDALNNGYQTLRIRACDDIENCSEENINFNLLIKNNPVPISKNTIKLTYPKSSLALNAADFPLITKFQISHPERIAQINLIIRDVAGKLSTLKTSTGEKMI